ncbi:hypothetical protein HI914_06750 [Erysiphe necator]|nr:hypothetical protein HI914_06750 [Erysiphe necator]
MVVHYQNLLRDLCIRKNWQPPVYHRASGAGAEAVVFNVEILNRLIRGDPADSDEVAKEEAAKNAFLVFGDQL